jgi:peptide deformylase
LSIDNGVALAANQIGVSKRLFVAHMPVDKSKDCFEDFVCINPRIVDLDNKFPFHCEEGCLSLPGYFEFRKRPGTITLAYQDINGDSHRKDFKDFTAFAIQHELEHLDGKMFIDNYSKFKLDKVRKIISKKGKRVA